MESQYPLWANILKDFALPLLAIVILVLLARYVLQTNREDRRNQMREQHDRHTYARCHRGIKAVFVVLWGKDQWTRDQSEALWLEKVKAPIESDLSSELIFHDAALSTAWKKCLTDGNDIIEKVRRGEATTTSDLHDWEEYAGEFLKVALERLKFLDPESVR